MKITFVTETYPPEINGVALTVLSLVQHCRKLGHHVEVVRPEQPSDALKARERLVVEMLVPGAQLILIALMFVGRVGVVTLAVAIATNQHRRNYRYPEEKPIVG